MDRKSRKIIKTPGYPGGTEALKLFIKQTLTFPKEALREGITGMVTIGFSIDHKGRVSDLKVLKSVGFGCDEEALRIVSLLQYSVPHNSGVRVRFHKKLNIHFMLEKNLIPDKPLLPHEYHYTITSSASKGKPVKYEYNIRIK